METSAILQVFNFKSPLALPLHKFSFYFLFFVINISIYNTTVTSIFKKSAAQIVRDLQATEGRRGGQNPRYRNVKSWWV